MSGQGISLTTQFFRLDWTLRFTRPLVIIDGNPSETSWGESFFPLEPGSHRLQVSYPYLGAARGKASAVVEVPQGQVAHVTYRTPISVLVASHQGKLIVESPESAP